MRVRALWPREHGAFGQLGFPLATALLAARPTAPALLLTGAAIAAFLAHEPALVASGRRGRSAQEQDGARALRWFVLAGLAALALGAAGLWLATRPARAGAAIAAVLGSLLAGAVYLKAEKTLAGELIAAAAMTSAGFMVALASNMPWALAAALWETWLLAFAAAVFPVRSMVARAPAAARIVPTLATIAAAAFVLPRDFAACAAPVFAVSLFLALKPPPMKEMTRAGWMLMIAGLLTTIALVVTNKK